MQIDEILKAKKTARRKKKTNEEALDSFADHEVSRLREAMNSAAEEDINSNHEKVPAVAKLKLLPEAMEALRKSETCFTFYYILNSTTQGIASAVYDRQ
jgi:transcription factor SPN1